MQPQVLILKHFNARELDTEAVMWVMMDVDLIWLLQSVVGLPQSQLLMDVDVIWLLQSVVVCKSITVAVKK